MPQVVAFVKTTVAAWQAWAKVNTLAAFLITTTAAIGVSYAIGRLIAPKFSNGLGGGSPLQMGRDPISPRRVVYGTTRVSGPIVFWHETGTKREFAHVVVALAGHEVEAIGDVYFNDEVIALDGAGIPTGTYAGLARVKKLLGSDSQTADSDLVAECSPLWTTDHRLRGIAALYARLKYDDSKWPGGLPNLSAVVQGRKVYDPRSDTTAWSNNPALCVRDYLTNSYFGLGVAATEIDDASFIAAANVCDEDVALAAGGTEKRYTCNGSFELSAEPAVVLERLCSSFAGMVIYAGGKWVCHAGAYRTPVVTLDESDLRAPITVQTKSSLRDTCNRVKGLFSSPAEKWQMADVFPVTSSEALAEDGGVEIWRDMELAFTTSHSTAQRLFKIELQRSRHDKAVRFPGKLTCLRVKAGDMVLLNNTRWGWSAKAFMVTNLKFNTYDAAGEMAIGVDLDLVETSSAVFGWVSGEEQIYTPGAATTMGDPLNVPTPAGLALTTNNNNQSDGTIFPRLKVAWTAPSDQFVLSGGYVHIEYKRPADTEWTVWTTTLRGTATFDFITDVIAGLEYQVRVRFENVYRIRGPYASSSATVVLDTTLPAKPTGLTATGLAGGILLDWNDNSEADLAEYALMRSTAADFTGAVEIWRGLASAFTDFTVEEGTTYYYKVIAVDATGNESPDSDPANAFAQSTLTPTGLVANPDFQSGMIGWETASGYWTIANNLGEGGSIWGAKVNNTSASQLVNLFQFPAKSGERYSVRAHGKGTSGYARITFFDDAGNEVFYITTDPFDSNWSFREAYGTVPKGVVKGRAEFLPGGSTSTYVDSIDIQRIAAGVPYTPPDAIVPPVEWDWTDAGGGTRTVTLTNSDGAAAIKYRVNGGSLQTYSSPFTVSQSDEVTFFAERSGYASSNESRAVLP